MKKTNLFTNKLILRLLIILIISIAAVVFVRFDYFLYDDTIATVREVTETKADKKTGFDGKHEYEENYYTQDITAEIRNGSNKGKTVHLKNDCTESNVYDLRYKKGDDLFIERVESEGTELTGVITSQKRDYYVAFALVSLVALFVLIGGSKSMLTVLSLALNMGCFYAVILLYFKGYNMLLLSIPMIIIFAALLLLFMYGRNIKTLLAFAATLITTALTVAIAAVSLNFSGNIDYDFLEYMIQPYDPIDARNIFLAEILVGCMGAVMDVVVTMIITIDEITLNNPQIEKKSLKASCRNVGDEIVGTMIAIMFFTNIASGIPFFILSMRNGIAIHTILRYNCFFEIARFLSGSIAVVLAIPVASFIGISYYKRRIKAC